MRTASLLLVVGLLGCRDGAIREAGAWVALKPQALVLRGAWNDGEPVQGRLVASNDSRSTLDVEWDLPVAPFELVDPPSQLEPGETALTVRFASTVSGHFSQHLTLRPVGLPALDVGLDATAQPIPFCEPSSTCVTVTFDKTLRQCVERALPDGDACDPQSLCVDQATCQAGRCVGTQKSCDDGNRCTVDVCNAGTGCEHLPAPPCPGDGICQVGVCEPSTGCGLAPAQDGLSCGATNTCISAQVCIAGQCVARRPPAGWVCAEASPCEPEGRCVADVCVRQGPKSVLRPDWSFDSEATGDLDAGVLATHYTDLVLEPSGAMTLGNFFQAPLKLRANTPQARVAPDGVSRRCVLWNDRLACADYPNGLNGRVSLIEPATGLTLWTFDLHAARPDLAALTSNLFMARLVVQGSDRLAALFEAYPAFVPPNTATLCRSYFLVVLDSRGRLVMGQQLVDPMFDVCNHPHPYGVVADVVGNLFIAFSPSKTDHAPLVPTTPTLLVSATHDGVLRWKLTEPTMVGGELAVARGLLYPENSDVVLSAATGHAAFMLPEVAGRVVISDARLLTAPVTGQTTLTGYEAGTSLRRWSHVLPAPTVFWSEPLRLASWATSHGPETVALVFTESGGGTRTPVQSLRGITVRDGAEAFSCPVSLGRPRTGPQLFEVANGSLALMEGVLDSAGAPGCSKCDPPFAGGAGRFHSLPVPGLSVAREPWLGTFGGAGHDHQEEQLPWGGAATPSN